MSQAHDAKTLERELKVDEEQVREEHLREVNVPAHWAYLFGMLGFGLVLMIGLMFLLGATSGG